MTDELNNNKTKIWYVVTKNDGQYHGQKGVVSTEHGSLKPPPPESVVVGTAPGCSNHTSDGSYLLRKCRKMHKYHLTSPLGAVCFLDFWTGACSRWGLIWGNVKTYSGSWSYSSWDLDTNNLFLNPINKSNWMILKGMLFSSINECFFLQNSINRGDV